MTHACDLTKLAQKASLPTSILFLTVSKLSSDLISIFSRQSSGGFKGGIRTSGWSFEAGSIMSATLKFFPQSLQILRPKHLAINTCTWRKNILVTNCRSDLVLIQHQQLMTDDSIVTPSLLTSGRSERFTASCVSAIKASICACRLVLGKPSRRAPNSP